MSAPAMPRTGSLRGHAWMAAAACATVLLLAMPLVITDVIEHHRDGLTPEGIPILFLANALALMPLVALARAAAGVLARRLGGAPAIRSA